MTASFKREIEYLRIGYLTYYILKTVQGMPKVGMTAFYALLLGELENTKRLGAGKSMLHSRLKYLSNNGFLDSDLGLSSNPKAKKKVRFYQISKKGTQLLNSLSVEQKRISDSLRFYD